MTFFYPDVSNVGNHGLTIENGTVVVCAKASEGTSFKDPSYHAFAGQAAAVKAHFFAYHWTWCENPQAEAQNAYDMVGKDVPIMWDVENTQRMQTVDGVLDLTRRFRALGGHASLVYLPRWYWEKMGSPSLAPLADAGMRLVSSSYTAYTETGPGWRPYGGVLPYVWQYADNEPYSGQRCDFNAVRDTLSGFITNVWPTGAVPPPAPQDGDVMLTHWTTVKAGNTGQAARVAQGVLLAQGFPVGSVNGRPDGDFGPVSVSSTRAMQQKFGVSVDGEFGPHTLSVGLYGHDYA